MRFARDKKVYIARNRKLGYQVAADVFSNNAIMPTTSRGLDHADEPNQRKNIRADLAAMEAAGVKPDIPADWTDMRCPTEGTG